MEKFHYTKPSASTWLNLVFTSISKDIERRLKGSCRTRERERDLPLESRADVAKILAI